MCPFCDLLVGHLLSFLPGPFPSYIFKASNFVGEKGRATLQGL